MKYARLALAMLGITVTMLLATLMLPAIWVALAVLRYAGRVRA